MEARRALQKAGEHPVGADRGNEREGEHDAAELREHRVEGREDASTDAVRGARGERVRDDGANDGAEHRGNDREPGRGPEDGDGCGREEPLEPARREDALAGEECADDDQQCR
ncbi:hypothetical protein ACFPRL_21415 [Pseudoclavibacter helvolus]